MKDATARWRPELALAAVTLLWGSSFTLVKSALDDVSVVLFLALRFTVAAVALACLYWRQLAGNGAAIRGGIWCGLLLAAAYLLQTFGQKFTTPARSGFLTALNVVLVPFFAALVYKSVPRWMEATGILLALAGMSLMTLSGAGGFGNPVNRGDILTIGCAIAYAVHILVVGEYVKGGGFAALSVTQVSVTAGLCWLAVAAGFEPLFFRPSTLVWAAVLITGLLCTALAFTVMAWAQQHTTPTRVALIFALEPISAWLTSYLVLGERLGAWPAVGAGLILAGVAAVEWKPARSAAEL